MRAAATLSGVMVAAALVCAAPSFGQSNACRSWCDMTFPLRDNDGNRVENYRATLELWKKCKRDAIWSLHHPDRHPRGLCFTCGPAGNYTTNAGLCGSVCCEGNAICMAGTCVVPTPTAVPAPNPCAGKPDGTTCDAGTDSAHTLICVSGACGQCTAFAGSPRFVDNGDGTITDRQTCLVWEKKDDAGGIHDKDTPYQWSSTGTAMDGGAFTIFIDGLNSASFGGHHDWRLPSEDGRNSPFTGPTELESILAAPYFCSVGPPCVDAAFNTNCTAGCSATGVLACSCTQSYVYWSATTFASSPSLARLVSFYDGYVFLLDLKTNINYVRAVRGGL